MPILKPIVYLRMRKKIVVRSGQELQIQDICHVITESSYQYISNIPVYTVKQTDGKYLIIDVMQIFHLIHQQESGLDLHHIGSVQTVVEIQRPKHTPHLFLLVMVGLILFLGSGLTIMNFHTDVSMKEVHQRIYHLMTGKTTNQPLLLQIPYSLGIGAGMILFFSRVFKKKLSDEPSPMELEMFSYQDLIDQYMIDQKKNKSDP